MFRVQLPNFQRAALSCVDLCMEIGPQHAHPGPEVLRALTVIAHRGLHRGLRDGVPLKENTIAAFDAALDCGVHGLEFDVRWTADNVPVISHDSNCRRVFSLNLNIEETTSTQLRASLPELPFLSELIERYARKTHLMIELKDWGSGKSSAGLSTDRLHQLRDLLSHLKQQVDYHFMSISPSILHGLCTSGIFAPASLLSVAEWNPLRVSRDTLTHRYGGFTAQYLLTSAALIERHHAAQQLVGTGLVDSKNVLYREAGRGIDSIFTNNPEQIMRLIQSSLSAR
jgi:glycerophosphoryl diester phosphodiesterase